jgi:branched-chain amino acid transport system permease protein
VSAVRLRSRSSAAASVLAPLVLVGLAVLVGAKGTPSLQSTVTLVLCNLIVVLGLQVFIGNSGVYSFGQLAFAAVGAYVAALLTLPAAITLLQTPGLPPVIAGADQGALAATLIAAAVCGLLAAVVGLPLMRTSTLAIPISTFAFLIVAYNVLANWEAVTGGSAGLVSIPTTTGVETAGLWAAVAVVFALAFKWSASGYRLQATREDVVAARWLGVAVRDRRCVGRAPVRGPLPRHLLLRSDGDDPDDAGRRRYPQRLRGCGRGARRRHGQRGAARPRGRRRPAGAGFDR